MRSLVIILLALSICLEGFMAPAYALMANATPAIEASADGDTCDKPCEGCADKAAHSLACKILCMWVSPGLVSTVLTTLEPHDAFEWTARPLSEILQPMALAFPVPPPRLSFAA